MHRRVRPASAGSLTALAALVGIGVALMPRSWFGAPGPARPELQFWFVSVGAALCLSLSCAAWIAGLRRHQAEVVLLGSAFTAMSMLSLVHGLGAPGVLVEGGTVSELSMALAFPVTVVGVAPLFVPERLGTRLARHCALWSSSTLALAAVLCVAIWWIPSDIRMPAPLGALVAAVVAVVVVRVAGRQVRLWNVGHNRASLVAALGIVTFGVATVVGVRAEPDSAGWWMVHVANNAAVLAVGAALLVGYRPRRDLRVVLGPVLTRDPLRALELGLSPEVHAFLAALDRKDRITRDHVVRTSELAMRMAEHMRLTAAQLRSIGLGALLHDIGKLVVPDEVLTKPGALSDEEFATMRSHAELGALILDHSTMLRDVAPIVRSHHERWDGAGYPDGLTGEEIPLGATVVSVADSWDAMTHTRQYRRGMDRDTARRILDEGAGTQWSPAAVGTLDALLDAGTAASDDSVLGEVGRSSAETGTIVDCLDALPPEVRASLGDVLGPAPGGEPPTVHAGGSFRVSGDPGPLGGR